VEPPRPVNTTPAVPLDAPAGRVVEAMEGDVLVVFTLVGFCAPQGLSSLHAAWQVESPLHAVTHWFPYSWHSKYGIVREYSEALGVRPLPQIQSKVRVVASQSLAAVVPEAPGYWRQISGHEAICDWHHDDRVEMGTLLGSMEYCCWARAEVEKSVVTKMAAEILNEGISRTFSSLWRWANFD